MAVVIDVFLSTFSLQWAYVWFVKDVMFFDN